MFKGTVHLVAEWLSVNLPLVLLIINLNDGNLFRFIDEGNFCPRHVITVITIITVTSTKTLGVTNFH